MCMCMLVGEVVCSGCHVRGCRGFVCVSAGQWSLLAPTSDKPHPHQHPAEEADGGRHDENNNENNSTGGTHGPWRLVSGSTNWTVGE
jgi:hypothetical protein